MDSQTIAAYDADSAKYAREWREQPTPHDMHALLHRFFTPGRTADIGCGSGRDADWLATQGHQVWGYDASEGLLNEARVAFPAVRFQMAMLPDLDGIERGSFTNVLCETVLMHLAPSEVGVATRALLALLAPGGTLYLSWRVTSGESKRDDGGRLYAAFDARTVTDALGSNVSVLFDREDISASSRKVIHRLIVRAPTDSRS